VSRLTSAFCGSFSFSIGGAAVIASTTLAVQPAVSGNKGVVVKAASGQSANLQEWQNSSGTVLTAIDNNGRVVISSGGGTTSTPDLYLNNTSTTSPIIKWNSITGNPGMWFVSNNSIICKMYDNGVVEAANTLAVQDMYLRAWNIQRGSAGIIAFNGSGPAISVGAGTLTTADSTIQITVPAAAKKGLIVAGVASQTGNLQEWQNNSGTANSWINSSGNEFSTNGINLTSYTTSYIKFDTSGQGVYRTGSWMGVGAATFGSGFFIEASNYGRPNIRSAYPAGNGEDSIILNTTTSLVSSLSRIATFQNNGTTGAYILRDGDGVFSGVRVGTGASGTGNAILGGNSNSVNTGNYNTLIGWEALYNKVAGANNVAVGADAGYYQADGSTTLTTTSNSIYIGTLCRGFNNSDSNSIVIGYQAIGKGANTTVIGNTSTSTTYLYGETQYIGGVAGTAVSVQPQTRSTSGAGANLNSFCWL